MGCCSKEMGPSQSLGVLMETGVGILLIQNPLLFQIGAWCSYHMVE